MFTRFEDASFYRLLPYNMQPSWLLYIAENQYFSLCFSTKHRLKPSKISVETQL